MRLAGVLRVVVVFITVGVTWFIASNFLNIDWNLKLLKGRETKDAAPRVLTYKCGTSQPCPKNHFAFKIESGAANVVGPRICFEGKILMSSVKNNVGPGINIALLDGATGEEIETNYFNMYSGDVKPLIDFMAKIKPGTLVLAASYDDIATKMNPEARKYFTEMGSSLIDTVKFRDNWIFAGAKGIQEKSPFEQYIKNNGTVNKYEGWPELIAMTGCIPQKMD
ncbi:protein FAM3D [Protopterus annectens]|uniref:protein FAM3D n=1 Tax=Protopterus annectens TaxID=7888 RepID=UPI001CF98221|nr:protein FAM3D [Protopterus annectens]XP_043934751.1 protein FAM3D [Protopterus annectens]XP_043934752.1 protein FAM3D [Protopterus annectens]